MHNIMGMPTSERPIPNPRRRGPYVSRACNICRAKKTRCDGVKPVCSPCATSGRGEECSWGRDSTSRKPKTDTFLEALKMRSEALQSYVDRLERLLARCTCQTIPLDLHLRRQEAEEQSHDEKSESDFPDSDEEISRELTVPTQRLRLDDQLGGGLLLHGTTAPLRHALPSVPGPPQHVVPRPEHSSASYILLVDGMDEADAHPHVDWARYLPRTIRINRREHDQILETAFKFWTGWGLRIVPSLFLKDMYRALSCPPSQQRTFKTPSYSAMLHNALLSICAIFSNDPYMRDRKTRQIFAHAAQECLESECRKPQISLVQALGFLGTFYWDTGDRIIGDLYIGMSSRVGMTLGLEVDSAPWVKSGLITREEMLGRGWTFWSERYRDVCWALLLGRHFPMDRANTEMPFVDEVADRIPMSYANIPPQPNLVTLIFNQTTALSLISCKIIDLVNGLDRAQQVSVNLEELIMKIDLDLYKWKSQLPSELDITLANKTKCTPYRLVLHCEYWAHFIFLHRPFFGRKSQTIQHEDREIDHDKLCKRAAENILDISRVWSSLHGLHHSPPVMLQWMFSGGTIFLLTALQATSSNRIARDALQMALEQVGQSIKHLHEMGRTWGVARRMGDLLRSILDDKLHPTLTRRMAQKGLSFTVAPAAAATPVGTSRPLERVLEAPDLVPQPPRPTLETAPVPVAAGSAEWNPASWSLDPASSYLPVQPQPMFDNHSFSYPPYDENAQELDPEIAGFLPNFNIGAPEVWLQDPFR